MRNAFAVAGLTVALATPAAGAGGDARGADAVQADSSALLVLAQNDVGLPRLPRPRPAGAADPAGASAAEAVSGTTAAEPADNAIGEAAAVAASPEIPAAEETPEPLAEARGGNDAPETLEIPVAAEVPAAATEPGAGQDTAALEMESDGSVTTVPRPRPRPSRDGSASTEAVQSAAEEAGVASSESADNAAAADSAAAPLPRPRPDLTTAEAARLLAMQFHGFQPDFVLRAALDAVTARSYGEALGIAARHPDPLVPSLIEWLVARQPDSGMSAAKIIGILASHRGWPEPEQLQLRAEQAFHAFGPASDEVLAFYSQAEPLTFGGRMALASAFRDAGRLDEATEIVRDLWRHWSLAPSQAATLLTRFGAMLTADDNMFRFRRLVLRRRLDDAVSQAQLVGPGYDSLARAVIAVLERRADASSTLRAIAPRFLGDELYVFARVYMLLRSDQPIEAARLLIGSRPNTELNGDGDIWWEERQDLSRVLLDRGMPDLAYQIVAEARPEGESDRVNALFHAGWYALRFLDDPVRAEPHFRELHTLATIPRTQARASYWLGRTHEAEGRTAAARLDYVEAARFGGTFYGQLSREKLGIVTTGLERMPRASALDRIRFGERDLVRIVRLMASAGYAAMARPFLRTLGESVDTPGEVALLTTLARRIDQPSAGIAAAAAAENRGLKVACLPALFFGVPSALRTPDKVDRALVYAVVRQESAFNHTAVSHAGARGLMQLMPATAKATARNVRIPFSEQRLVTDPLYNATLGAHHLKELLGGLRSSYILTFAGYNAGPGRALQWVRAYGDPRGGTVDPIDWVERIPFDETRDYVQKVMENLQLYRSRTGHALSLSQDLVRGSPQS